MHDTYKTSFGKLNQYLIDLLINILLWRWTREIHYKFVYALHICSLAITGKATSSSKLSPRDIYQNPKSLFSLIIITMIVLRILSYNMNTLRPAKNQFRCTLKRNNVAIIVYISIFPYFSGFTPKITKSVSATKFPRIQKAKNHFVHLEHSYFAYG